MIYQGDCLEVLKRLESSSVDSLITDPPAGISFMGKSWDSDKGGRKDWIAWMTEVMRECLRVLKPGAHGLVWAIPRTSHWTATALEDAGFEVRDVITHLFGSGFPKSLDVSKAIDKAAGAEREVIRSRKQPDITNNRNGDKPEDRIGSNTINGIVQYKEILDTAPATDAAKQWAGWGTALKPAAEHWILVRKPISEKTVAANVLKWGTGALNIDGSRIAPTSEKDLKDIRSERVTTSKGQFAALTKDDKLDRSDRSHVTGRFPANLVLSHTEHCTDDQCDLECSIAMLDAQSGVSKSPATYVRGTDSRSKACYSSSIGEPKGKQSLNFGDSGGASRFFYCAKVSSSERNAGLEGMPDKVKAFGSEKGDGLGRGISGTRTDLPTKNHHPTVKPQKLMRYLCRMITPPGGIVLDPFMGSGSTGLAAQTEGFQFIGIEKEPEYFDIAEKRMEACV